MRKRFGILFFCLLGCGLIAAAWWFLRPAPEPIFHGSPMGGNVCDEQPLSVCLEALVSDHNPMNNEAGAEAVRGIGTNAIPFLLRMLQEHDSKFATRFFELADKQTLIHINHTAASHRNFEAVAAFKLLGPKASNAVPELLEIYVRNKHEEVLASVADCLGAIGPPASAAIPALLRCASGPTQTDERPHQEAIQALGEIQSEPEVVVPKLITILSDPDPYTRCISAIALANFGCKAKMAIPLITANLDRESNQWLKNEYFMALHEIDWDAAWNWLQTNAVASTSNSKH